MTIYRASCTYNEKDYEYCYEWSDSKPPICYHRPAAQQLVRRIGVAVHRSKPEDVKVKIERFYVKNGELQQAVCYTITESLPFLPLTADEYEQEMAALLDGLPEKTAAFIRNKAYEDHHSSGYESVLNAADDLLEEMRAAGLA